MATNETKEAKVSRYAAYIDALIAISPKSQATIAKEAGYENPINSTLFPEATHWLPVNKVR
ncbi:hypothetical protein QM042_02475 [Escherichia coli]